MAENSNIEWTDHTANLWWGCKEVQTEDGCLNCYARTFARSKGKKAWQDVRYRTKAVWKNLGKWDRQALETFSRPARVFVGSMMDIFERPMPLVDWQGRDAEGSTADLRQRFFVIAPRLVNLHFLLLTKRPSNILKMVPKSWLQRWPRNVWTGTSPTTQRHVDTLLPQLLKVPGKHFLSCEPLLSRIDLTDYLPRIGWVIAGGESGAGARPMHPDWVRDLRDQCREQRTPFFFKQWGRWAPCPRNIIVSEASRRIHVFDDGLRMISVGKKAAGNLLDGKIHQEWPAYEAGLVFAEESTPLFLGQYQEIEDE